MTQQAIYLEKTVTAGGDVLRAYFSNVIVQEMIPHSLGGMSSCFSAEPKPYNDAIPHRYAETPVDLNNIITAFKNSIDRYIATGISLKGCATIPDARTPYVLGAEAPAYSSMLGQCRYVNNNSFFRWQSAGSKKLIHELKKILEKPLEPVLKARALCEALALNISLAGKGLRNIFILNELLDPKSNFPKEKIMLSRYVIMFLKTQNAEATREPTA